MPHKHTRKSITDSSELDLPPTTIAKPLPVSKSSNKNGIFITHLNPQRSNKKRKRKPDKDDDTPKAFVRLMAFQQGKKLPKGLDDGVQLSKGKRRAIAAREQTDKAGGHGAVAVQVPAEVPIIRPGERMGDFAARVDAALPVAGLINKSVQRGKDPLGLKVGRTKTEKRMHRMYDGWREQDRKIKEKKQEELELAEEAMDNDGAVKWKVDLEDVRKGEKKRRGKRKKMFGEVDDGDGDGDPWKEILTKRGEQKVGLNDVVQAPPTFTKVPKEKFKDRGARVEIDDVPKASGSLRRREELGEVRKDVVKGYRQMMKGRANAE